MTYTLKAKVNSTEDEKKISYLSFLIGNAIYGVELENIYQIMGINKMITVLDQINDLQGYIEHDGHHIAVVDLRIKFAERIKKYDEKTCIVILKVEDGRVGVIVDEVLEVIKLTYQDIYQVHQFNPGIKHRLVKALGLYKQKIIILLSHVEILNMTGAC